MRVAFCASCGTPVTIEDLLPVQSAIVGLEGPKQPARPAAQGKESFEPAAVPEVSS
jgi:hypothetical protein